jgi:hypothetical protein
MDFPTYVYERIRDALATCAEPADVYAVSLFIYDDEDDPLRPTVTAGWNTEAQVRFAMTAPDHARPNPWWKPADEAEARWNYAFWRQDSPSRIGGGDDKAGASLRREWLVSLGLYEEEPDTSGNAEWEAWLSRAQRVTQRFVDLIVATARQLHDDGTILRIFGRPVPVVVHELEYYDAIADQAVAANPSGLADEFAAWVRSGG